MLRGRVDHGDCDATIRVLDGAAFDPVLNGLKVAARQGGGARSGWWRVESLEDIVFGR